MIGFEIAKHRMVVSPIV